MPGRTLIVLDTNLVTYAAPTGSESRKQAAQLLIELFARKSVRIVLPDKLDEEWQRNMSPYSTQWYAQMVAARRFNRTFDQIHNGLYGSLGALVQFDLDGRALAHDFKLVDAARTTDAIILSNDEGARCFFSRASRTEARIREVCWINPYDDFDCATWISRGSPTHQSMRLHRHWCRRHERCC
jgi:hypothetical protein